MIILAIDTCVDACSAAIWADGESLAALSEPMSRGHQERLAPMVAEVLATAGIRPAALDRIAVTVGPGSFTGLRVGLAFARSFALALDRPCIGVGTLEALVAGAEGFVAACLDARRERVYLQAFTDGRSVMAPDQLDIGAANARIAELFHGGPARILGSGAPLIAGVLPGALIDAEAVPDPLAIARLASTRTPGAPPRPLYLRAPDAIPVPRMTLEPAHAHDAEDMADIHARSFEHGWPAADIAALLAAPGGFGLLVRENGALRAFVLARAIAGEAEILTIATDPAARRRGLARALVEAAAGAAASAEAEALFLEVAADNPAAIGLYEGAGFARVGARAGYYARGNNRIDALVMRRALNTRPA